MSSSVWVQGNTPGTELHVVVDSMPAGGASLTDAELRATPVPVSGTVTIQDAGGPITVDGTVSVTGVATAANQLPDGHNVTVDNASLAVTGTFWQATQPVSGTFWQATQPISGTVSVNNFPGAASGLMYFYNIPSQVHVASANTVHWDLFNADASLVVTVMGIYQLPNITTAVTGVAFDWSLIRTTSVGTGGSAQTVLLPDLSQTALDADITCRSKPTGGAASGVTLRTYTVHSEETNAATQMFHMMNAGGIANLVPPNVSGIVLRQNQGIKCVQVTNSNAGNTGWCICFMVE